MTKVVTGRRRVNTSNSHFIFKKHGTRNGVDYDQAVLDLHYLQDISKHDKRKK